MAYDWTNLIAPAFSGLFIILAVILAWILAKMSVNKYQRKKDENNQREILIEDFNNLIDQANRIIISFSSSFQPDSGNSSFDFVTFKSKRDENLLNFMASNTLLVRKLRLRMPSLDEETLKKINDTPDILFSIYNVALSRLENKTEIMVEEKERDVLQSHLNEIFDIILTSKID